MRVRTFIVTSALAGVTIAGAVAAGTASAATPFVIPQAGAAGLELSPAETGALANSPIPALADRYAPNGLVTVVVQPDSALPQDDYSVYAGLRDIVAEAANHPGGTVDLIVDSEGVVLLQDW
ncbi:hypothetical protein [Nocardia inohanensis]|uniref:hypothetical protein n=1 Tax=Nocardia inohanensis TaxID=209246 RepID=UPI00082A2143|nr:hypothetical protein [Nocardia inohanensis]